MCRKRKESSRGIPVLLGVVLFMILLLTFILAAAGYGAVHPEKAEAFYEEFFGNPEGVLTDGTVCRALKTAAAGLWKAEEPEEPEEEKLPEIEPDLRLENTVDFAALWEENEDVYAWITIPGTLVDYPVLQHPTDYEYYLTHTIDHVEGLPGSVYSESLHPKDFSAANTILYGHNMKNDSMFGSLHYYENLAFFDGHPYVYVHLPDRTLVYRNFAAVKFQSVYLPEYLDFEKEDDFQAYVEELKTSPGYIDPDMEPSFGNRLLTLHTCIGNDDEHRYLVVAVLIGGYERDSV